MVLSASAGAGHVRAAEAMEKAFLAIGDKLIVQSNDVLDLTNKLFHSLYSKAYIDLVNRAPELVGFLYTRTDRPTRSRPSKSDKIRLAFDKLNTKKLVRHVRAFKPDLIVSTHFLPAEIVSDLKKKRQIDAPHAVIVTDFEVHSIWVYKNVEHYFVATDEAKCQLIKLGIDDKRIQVSGIPIDPIFSQSKDRGTLLRKFGLSENRKTILVLCGGFGVGPVDQIVKSLFEIAYPVQLIVVAGKNEALKNKLDRLALSAPVPMKVFGFTRSIDEMMETADLLVSKPGGLTTSEALAKRRIMVVVNPIPGQESRNSDFLLENGVAIKANHLSTMGYKIERLLSNPRRIQRMQENIEAIRNPEAALFIARQLLSCRPY